MNTTQLRANFFWRVLKIAKIDYWLRHVWLVLPHACNNPALIGRIVTKFDSPVFFENLTRTIQFHSNRTRTKGTSHEDQYTLSVVSRSILLRMKNLTQKRRRETRKTHFMFNNFFSKIVSFMSSGVPRNFVPREVNKFSWGQRTERTGIWGR